MRFTKRNNTWCDEDQSLMVFFFEDTSPEYLESTKRTIVDQGIDSCAVHTFFVTETRFGLVSIEPNHPITGLDWVEERDEAVLIENDIVANVINQISAESWDGLWFYSLMSANDPVYDPETGELLVKQATGLKDHVISFTDDRWCEVRKLREKTPFFIFQMLPYIDDLIPEDRDDLWEIFNQMYGEQ